MDEWSHACSGCNVRHPSAIWFCRDGHTAIYRFHEYLCGQFYDRLPSDERQHWRQWRVI